MSLTTIMWEDSIYRWKTEWNTIFISPANEVDNFYSMKFLKLVKKVLNIRSSIGDLLKGIRIEDKIFEMLHNFNFSVW